jgi:hypothetical protein
LIVFTIDTELELPVITEKFAVEGDVLGEFYSGVSALSTKSRRMKLKERRGGKLDKKKHVPSRNHCGGVNGFPSLLIICFPS